MPEDDLPPYPTLSEDTTIRLSREWLAHCWAGTPDRLVQLQKDAQDALSRAYATAVAALPIEPGQDEARYEAAEKIGEALRLRVQVAASGRLTRTGEVSAILAEMDLRDVETVQMWNERTAGLPQVVIKLHREQTGTLPPVQLKVDGFDRQWVAGTMEVLSSALERAVPWWTFFRRGQFAALVGAVAGLGLSAWWAASSATERTTVVLMIILGTIFGTLFGGVMLMSALRALFPALEVVEPGNAPRGRKVLGGFVTLIGLGLGVAGLVVGVMAL